jgi:nitrogen fixation-related uncharacterized protein
MAASTRSQPRPKLRVVPAIDRSEPSPRTRTFLWVFSVVLVLVAGSAFVLKLIEFIATATSDGTDALASFLIPVLNYLLVAAGFFSLFLWAYATGQFRDLEAAKYRMLEMQRELDLEEARQEGRS